ncbi:hypothetical protein EUZ85_09960 [Hahella sp. KA22]|uniref:hypothetical protein n=1 Tax=Hahella sp. KA22 TaxID=1628392 RepID=UPI000FDEB613|nr:hypothetical protein [Hahella sp. KA22]AZZ91028.1 hypothetical protein ENC22_07405 [Hahella sp. KA22]QAY54398.1 hypothetical protein EUZ85_09960 [Hahella sp. KA22]
MTDSQQKLIQELICDIFRASAEEQEKEGSQYEIIQTLHALEQLADNERHLLQELVDISLVTNLPYESEAIANILFMSLLAVLNVVADNCPARDRFVEINQWIDGRLMLALQDDVDVTLIRKVIQCATYARFEIGEEVIAQLNSRVSQDYPPVIGTPTMKSLIEAMRMIIRDNQCQTEWDLLHTLTHLGAQMPEGAAALYVGALLHLEAPWRDCAVMLTIDPVRKVRESAIGAWLQQECQALANEADLARLVAARKWLPEPERQFVDAIIKDLQRLRIGGIVAQTTKAQVCECYVSPFDSLGAFYISLVLWFEGSWKIWSARLQQGEGVTKGGLLTFPDREELDRQIAHGIRHLRLETTPLKTIQAVLRHFLLYNRESGSLPAPELLWLISHVEGEWSSPESMNCEEIADALEDVGELPADQWDFAKDMRQLAHSWIRPEWTREHPSSEALIEERFEAQRDIWRERFLLSAYFLQQQSKSPKEIELLRQAAAGIAAGKPLTSVSFIREMTEAAFHWEGTPIQWEEMPLGEMARFHRQIYQD